MCANFRSTLRFALWTSAAALCLPLSARAQSLFGLDTLGGAGHPTVVEHVGPSTGACGYPNAAALPAFAVGPGICPGPGPFGGWPGIEGDVAVNRYSDTVWVAGPNEVGEYQIGGVQVTGFANPLVGNLTGLGMDSTGGRLWLTTGAEYAAVLPGCGAATIAAGPFASPLAAQMTDISWDPHRGRLWASFDNGRIASFAPGGAATCVIDVTTLGLGVTLTGIAVDVSTPGVSSPSNKALFVTDGNQIARVSATASCASGIATLDAPTFAFPLNFWAVPGGALSGLAYSSHGITFGSGSGPQITFAGQSIIGHSGLSVDLSGAAPGVALLLVDLAARCPAGTVKGVPMLVAPTSLIGPVFHAGSLSLPMAIPAAAPAGREVYMQWFNNAGGGVWESTPGLVIRLSRP